MVRDLDKGEGGKVIRLDEQRLLVRHCEGDETAFEQLLALYRRPVYGYLGRCGVAAKDRDDLAQDVFLKIHLAAGRYRPEKPLKAWIFTIVANSVRSYFRKRSVWRRFFLAAAPRDEQQVSDAQNQGISEAKQTADYLEQVLSRLPDAQRQALLLSTMAGLDTQEVATVLDLPVGTVKTSIFRARKALAKALVQRETRGAREVSP